MESVLDKPLNSEAEDFNKEPVHFCTHCLSLRVKTIETFDYCDTCNSTDIESTDIHTWEKMYEDRYGVKYLNTKNNGRKKPNS